VRSFLRSLAVIGVVLAAGGLAWAEFTYSFDPNPHNSDNLAGLHLNRTMTDTFAHGLSWDLNGQWMWNTGLDITVDYSYPGVYPTPPDLVLAYSSLLQADNLRLRADDARMALGPRIGHPVMPFQFEVNAGTAEKPLGGIAIGTHGYQHGLYLYNRKPGLRRTNISLQNLYSIATDSRMNGTGDFQFYNYQAGAPTWTVQPNNDFRLTAPRAGFFSAAPVAQPVVRGSWSDGTAQKSLLSALVRLGLVRDETTR
jgi:hypothetical protein